MASRELWCRFTRVLYLFLCFRVVNAVIEIPKGCRAKYELDKDSGLLKLDRVLFKSYERFYSRPFIIQPIMVSFLKHIVMIQIP